MFTLPKATTATGSPSTSSIETDATAANLAAAGLLLPNFSIPSANFNQFLPFSMGIPQMSFTAAQLAQLGINSNPLMVPPPSYEQAMAQLLNAATPPDMARLAADLTTSGITDNNSKDENKNFRSDICDILESDEDKPLDLSMKRQNSSSTEASTSSAFRPSVIRGNGLTPSPRNNDIKRSASSVSHRVTPDPDVAEHFRRSFSGKWPRRQPSYGHYSPSNNIHLSTQSINNGFLARQELSRANSPFASAPIAKRLSFSSSPRSNCSSPQIRRVSSIPQRSQIIVCEGDNSEVETHFRRALGEERFQKIRNAQAAAAAAANNQG